MNHRLGHGISLAAILMLSTAIGDEPTRVTVKGDRVNLRARPRPDSEVVGQVNDGEVLVALRTEGDWVEVECPTRVDVWVHREFIRDGQVLAPNLQVRAGPGINYNRVGVLNKGDSVQVRGDFGEWLKIEPPPGTKLWVSRPLVQFPAAPKPAPEVAKPTSPKTEEKATPPPKPAPRPPTVASSRPVTPPPPRPPPPEFRLAPVAGQGRVVQREGYIQPVGYLFGRPSRYLLAAEKGVRMETVCYLWGNDQQLEGFRGRRLVIEGREYWLQGLRQPMLVVDRIRLMEP